MKKKKLFGSIKRFFRRFDRYQLLAIPLLLLLIYLSVDFKSNDINIGIVLPLSGNFSSRAQSHLNGIKLAVTHVNALGGINKSRIIHNVLL